MQKKWKGILQILNEKVRLIIFLTSYLFLLRIAFLFKIENPYVLFLVYVVFPFFWGAIVVLIYDKIVTSLKRKKR